MSNTYKHNVAGISRELPICPFVDDVISTGVPLIALEKLVNAAEGKIIDKAAVLAEGNAADRDDIFFFGKSCRFFFK